ncbi:MAG: UDP-glucose 4-epimerase GalE [Gammaproteobacteria bacterium]|nr:UDP-glucose 4-epimerase GalE [Gammaproteobacteria bacterium]
MTAKRGCVLVTGGAGYIGSHTTQQLTDAGYGVVVLDNLCTGHRWAVASSADFYEGDAGDSALLNRIFQCHEISTVIHFAAHTVVPESVADPIKYYDNNAAVSQRLITACTANGIDRFLFSSSAAVYGFPATTAVTEKSPTTPMNPYGTSKLITEWMLQDTATATSQFRYLALRYFNVAGARLDGSLGQATAEATHLIKVACEAACGHRPGITIFGGDYETRDGTCVRDYIHVDDLAAAHVAALSYLNDGGKSRSLNCGYGYGYTVREIVDTVRRVSGVEFPISLGNRRPGDPAMVVADNSLLCECLDWHPRHNDIELICRTAYEWERELTDRFTGNVA